MLHSKGSASRPRSCRAGADNVHVLACPRMPASATLPQLFPFSPPPIPPMPPMPPPPNWKCMRCPPPMPPNTFSKMLKGSPCCMGGPRQSGTLGDTQTGVGLALSGCRGLWQGRSRHRAVAAHEGCRLLPA